MPYRTIPFVNDQIYHIYNRGSEKRYIYDERGDYKRFLRALRYYQLEGPKPKLSHYSEFSPVKPDPSRKIVEIICYCFMPNHFHLMLKQIKEGGISEFMRKIGNSYAKYFNTRHSRIGPLFQGEFKAVLVESDEQLAHLSRYIHLNPYVAYLCKSLDNYEWSSYREYSEEIEGVCFKEPVLDQFKSSSEYEQFVLNRSAYAIELELIKHQLVDVED